MGQRSAQQISTAACFRRNSSDNGIAHGEQRDLESRDLELPSATCTHRTASSLCAHRVQCRRLLVVVKQLAAVAAWSLSFPHICYARDIIIAAAPKHGTNTSCPISASTSRGYKLHTPCSRPDVECHGNNFTARTTPCPMLLLNLALAGRKERSISFGTSLLTDRCARIMT